MWNMWPRRWENGPNYENRSTSRSKYVARYYQVSQLPNLKEILSYLPRINSFKSAETVSARRWCSLSPDRHEIRQKRKWLVGRGWCQALSIGGQKGAPSPSTAERQSSHDGSGPQWESSNNNQQQQQQQKLTKSKLGRSAWWTLALPVVDCFQFFFFERSDSARKFKTTSNSSVWMKTICDGCFPAGNTRISAAPSALVALD